MTDEQIKKWDGLATEHAEKVAATAAQWSMAWRMEFARLARADAWGTAASALRRRNAGRHPIMVSERVEAEKCAKVIDALAAAEKVSETTPAPTDE